MHKVEYSLDHTFALAGPEVNQEPQVRFLNKVF